MSVDTHGQAKAVPATSPQCWPIWKILFAQKLIVATLVFWAIIVIPDAFDVESFRAVLHWPPSGEVTWESRLATWDGAHYLHLAQHGYQSGSPSCAFYPLWPLLISAVSWLTAGNPLVAALIASNLLCVIAVVQLVRLGAEVVGPESAWRAGVLLIAYPSFFVTSFVYTEALFLALAISYMLALCRQQWWQAALLGALLPLTKAVGFYAALAPLAFCFVTKGQRIRAAVTMIGPMLGYIGYFFFMFWQTGNAFEGFVAQQHYPNSPAIANMLDWQGLFDAALAVSGFHTIMDSFLDRFFFAVFLCSLPWLWWLDRRLFLFALPVGLIPALSTWFVSYSRNMLSCFPIFFVLAWLFCGSRPRWVFPFVVGLFYACQLVLTWRYVNHLWST